MSSPFKTWRTHLPLARERFFVFRDRGKWRVRYREQSFGPYPVKAGAIADAITRAYRVGRQGTGVQVFVEVKGDEFRLEWTYGLDPFPAPG